MRVSTGRQVNRKRTAAKPCGAFADKFQRRTCVQLRRARRRDLTVAAMDASIQRSPAAISLIPGEQQRQARALFDRKLRGLEQRS